MVKPNDKGNRGEREVVAMWRRAGWDKAARSPGSGGMRPYGAGDLSPWPADLIGTKPFMVEVKNDERVHQPSRAGWPGFGFIRRTLVDLDKLAARHNQTVGGGRAIPVLFARSSKTDWRVFVDKWTFRNALVRDAADMGWDTPGQDREYVEMEPWRFFEEVAVRWPQNRTTEQG